MRFAMILVAVLALVMAVAAPGSAERGPPESERGAPSAPPGGAGPPTDAATLNALVLLVSATAASKSSGGKQQPCTAGSRGRDDVAKLCQVARQ